MILNLHLDKDNLIIEFFYIKLYYIMSNLNIFRNSFRLVSDAQPDRTTNKVCKGGKTFRSKASLSSVEFGQTSSNCNNIIGGTAKPGPTAVFDSALVRKRRIQVRTKSNKTGNSANTNKFERTFRGNNAQVQNGRDGQTNGRRAQLFGAENSQDLQAARASAGVRGNSSDVIYFRSIFERKNLNVSAR